MFSPPALRLLNSVLGMLGLFVWVFGPPALCFSFFFFFFFYGVFLHVLWGPCDVFMTLVPSLLPAVFYQRACQTLIGSALSCSPLSVSTRNLEIGWFSLKTNPPACPPLLVGRRDPVNLTKSPTRIQDPFLRLSPAATRFPPVEIVLVSGGSLAMRPPVVGDRGTLVTTFPADLDTLSPVRFCFWITGPVP